MLIRKILTHVVRAVAVLLIVSFITFCITFSNGTGVARAVLGVTANDSQVAAEVVRHGLDRPLFVQYGDWLGNLASGSLGESFFTGQAVTGALASRVPVTLSLVLLTLVLTAIISVILGVTAAVYGGWVDRVVQFVSVLGAAVPGFILAIVMILAFAVANPIFPATGYIRLTDDPSGWIWSLTLPVFVLVIGSVANAASQFRGAVADALSRDYVRTLRSRGIPERHIMFRHVLRNAAGPGLITLSLLTIGLLGGALFIETVFALPGVGQLSVESATNGDVPMVMGTVIFAMVLILVVNFLADFIGSLLNPKARAQ